MRNRSTCN